MILSVKNLKKSFYAGVDVINDVSFSLNKGEVISIIGSSGSGKSTLLRCLAQLETVNSGTIEICGETLVTTDENGVAVYADKEKRSAIQKMTGMVFQSFNLFPHMSVLQNLIDAPIRVLKIPREEAVATAKYYLEKMNLSSREDAYPCELSGGQQQRVAIARALCMKPEILCFDEPTSALDPELTVEVLNTILALRQEGRTMIVVTHEMEFARAVSDKVIYLSKGVIAEEGAPEDVFGNPQTESLRAFLRLSPKEAAESHHTHRH